jgi:molybdopterin synthase catalytic subunit
MLQIVDSPISLDALARTVSDPAAGAVATFAGTTRETNRGRKVVKLEYEAYERMAVSEFEKIASEIRGRWDVCRLAIVHRVGVVPVGETSVAIAVSAPHRADALEACRFAIDRLKHVAPIWKKEHFEGGEVWIGSLADCDHQVPGELASRAGEGAEPPSAAGNDRRRSS